MALPGEWTGNTDTSIQTGVEECDAPANRGKQPGPWPQGDVRMPGVLSTSPPATFSYSWKKLLDSLFLLTWLTLPRPSGPGKMSLPPGGPSACVSLG